MNTLKRKLMGLFKESEQLRNDYLRLRLKETGKNGKGEMLVLLSMKLADSLNPREWRALSGEPIG